MSNKVMHSDSQRIMREIFEQGRLAVAQQHKEPDEEEPMWPFAPYHHGMGRIRGYEEWLHTLSEEELTKELEAAKKRGTMVNQSGFEMDNSRSIMREIFEQGRLAVAHRPKGKTKSYDWSRERER